MNEKLISNIDGMTADFMLMDDSSIDVPTAGLLLNRLEPVIEEARLIKSPPMERVAEGMTTLLEQSLLDAISNDAKAVAVLGKGVTLLQEICSEMRNTGAYSGSTAQFMAELGGVIGADSLPQIDEPAAAPAAAGAAEEEMSLEDQIKAVLAQIPGESSGKGRAAAVGQSQPEQAAEPEPEQAGTPQAPVKEAPPAAQPAAQEEVRDESLLKDFIIEGLEYINEIEINILNLEQNPGDKEVINAIFRPFHSVKGVAGFLNLDVIRDLAHSLENLLDKVRNGEVDVTSGIIDIILDGADVLKALIENLKQDSSGECPEYEEQIKEVRDRAGKAQEGGQGPDEKVKKLGSILVEDRVISEKDLHETLEKPTDPPRKIGEALISEGKATPKQVSQALRKQTSQQADATSIRVDTNKLDDLIDMVGELVITQSMIKQDKIIQQYADKKLARNLAQLASITSELQRTSTSMRMIPIKQTFQRMSRLVRDLSKSCGKSINVVLTGEDTEIDRNMVEEIYNPLVHLVRNAVDHGIETPQERAAGGKPEIGLLNLKAYHRGGTIVIEIGDDGKGLDKDKIAAKAMSTGAVDSLSGLTDQDIFKLIFLPGLSTAAKVTDVSGRGVGMDVVKQAIEKLRGKIEIQSVRGKGTTFTASFPLTLAIIDGMIVRVGAERYIVPTSAVRQLLRPEQSRYSSVVNKGEMINVRGKLMPLVRLHSLFSIEPQHRQPWEALVMVMDSDGKSKCVMVDEILGKEEVVVKGLSEGVRSCRGVSGGAILGDGNIGLILDPEGLFDLSESL
jgi:two-component system chemotaxis sensor kinase CheA